MSYQFTHWTSSVWWKTSKIYPEIIHKILISPVHIPRCYPFPLLVLKHYVNRLSLLHIWSDSICLLVRNVVQSVAPDPVCWRIELVALNKFRVSQGTDCVVQRNLGKDTWGWQSCYKKTSWCEAGIKKRSTHVLEKKDNVMKSHQNLWRDYNISFFSNSFFQPFSFSLVRLIIFLCLSHWK